MHKILLVALLAVLSISCSKETKPLPTLEPAAAFEKANEILEKKNYEEARRTFDELKRSDIDEGYAPLAQLRIADSYVKEEEAELAIDEYKRFLKDYPRHKYASYAQYQIGMVYYNLVRGPDRGYGAALRALEAFQSLNSLYPRNPYRDEVKYYMEKTRDVIAMHEFMVGDFYFKKGACEGVIGRMEGLLRDFPEYKDMPEVLYRLGVCHKRLEDNARAEQDLNMLRRRYPESPLIEKTEKEFREIAED